MLERESVCWRVTWWRSASLDGCFKYDIKSCLNAWMSRYCGNKQLKFQGLKMHTADLEENLTEKLISDLKYGCQKSHYGQ